jgi:thiosulfate dehydrogenase (quinone) large subunit
MRLTVESPEFVTPAPPPDGAQSEGTPPTSALIAPPLSTGDGRTSHDLRLSKWLFRSRTASGIWLVVRLWLGYQWLNAGYQKIWGSERAFFWFGGGAGVKGFASAGVSGSTAGSGGASYGWWAGFLHNFVIPNASWIARFIAVSECLIGIALILGLFTGAAALAGLSLNVIYMFTGSAGVNPMYAILSVLLVLAWRNAGWCGVDRFIFGSPWWRENVTERLRRSFHRAPSSFLDPASTR